MIGWGVAGRNFPDHSAWSALRRTWHGYWYAKANQYRKEMIGHNLFERKHLLPVLAATMLAWGCGSSNDGDATTTNTGTTTDLTATPPQGAAGADAAATTTDGATSTATADRYDATGKLDPTGRYTHDGSLAPGVVLTPTEERSDAMMRMNGIRATLVADLDEVRSHLKDGTLDAEHAAADKKRAADLAQGLERVDRTLKAMGGATDATWAEMRNTQLKEVDEVRAWWRGYVNDREANAMK